MHLAGDFAVLLSAGMSVKMALFANFLSACTCYIGLVIGLVLGQTVDARLWIFALAGGIFLYVALVDMVSKALSVCYFIAGQGNCVFRRQGFLLSRRFQFRLCTHFSM